MISFWCNLAQLHLKNLVSLTRILNKSYAVEAKNLLCDTVMEAAMGIYSSLNISLIGIKDILVFEKELVKGISCFRFSRRSPFEFYGISLLWHFLVSTKNVTVKF